MIPVIGQGADGRDVQIRVERLIETRALIMANSGGGKSWAIRRLLEQTHGSVQQIVIDVEDEFATLRERFDYVLAGKGGDCPAEVRSAALLARRLLELRVSAIVGIYELKPHDRIRFVKLFLEEMINAPKELWHSAMVVIDEAHMFAPEGKQSEATQAVIDLMNRGRKRGFCGILATQRPAQLHKDASAQANNKMIGRFSQDIDVDRAAKDLGFYKREQQATLRTLKPGEFFVVGPALSDDVAHITVGPVLTRHPSPGERAIAPPPAPKSVKAILAKLSDLPAEAEQEARTSQELMAKVRELEAENRRLAAAQPETRLVDRPVLTDEHLAKLEASVRSIGTVVAELTTEIAKVRSQPVRPPTPERPKPAPAQRQTSTVKAHSNGHGTLPGPQQRIVDAIAWLEDLGIDSPEQVAVAFLAGYTTGGGAFNNPRGALRQAGIVEYVSGDRIRLTDSGRSLAHHQDAVLTADELQARVMARLPGPEQKILRVLLDCYPEPMANDECAAASGYSAGGGAYNNPRGRLRTLGLIDYPSPGFVVAKPLLFLEGQN